MQLSAAQQAACAKDGFLVFPDLAGTCAGRVTGGVSINCIDIDTQTAWKPALRADLEK